MMPGPRPNRNEVTITAGKKVRYGNPAGKKGSKPSLMPQAMPDSNSAQAYATGHCAASSGKRSSSSANPMLFNPPTARPYQPMIGPSSLACSSFFPKLV